MKILKIIIVLFVTLSCYSQDTTLIQTLTFDSTARAYTFNFPDGSLSYRKVLMRYKMRCKDGNISNGSNPNLGCGEWDYSCNTFITDSSRIDSVKAIHPNFTVSNFIGNTFNYTSQPTYSYYQSTQNNVVYNSINSEVSSIIGMGANSTNNVFNLNNNIGKSQYLITAAELLNGGIVAGDLTGLKLDIDVIGDELKNLKIKIKETTDTQLNSTVPHIDGFTTVYYLNTTFTTTGLHQFNFSNNFNWDGVSNLIIEFSYISDGGLSTNVKSETISNLGISANNIDYSLEFNGANFIDISNSFNSISNEITLSFWLFGDETLPVKTSLFEGVDSQNKRQINLHMPWQNGSIYWDCGNDGDGYDRINKQATVQEYKNSWQHWTVTKNTNTGIMNIYLNGNLWKTGTAKTKTIDIQNLILGTNASHSFNYFGKIDELSIWDKELSQVEINNYKFKSIDNSHPDYSNLVAYYKFNEGSGTVLIDELGNHNGVINGNTVWRMKKGEDLNLNFTNLLERPNFIIIQGDYITTTTSTIILDSLINNQNLVKEFSVTGTDLNQINSFFTYESGNMPVYNEQGNIISNINVPAENTLNIIDLDYYTKTPSKYELMSFVTPYGLGLDFGMNGKVWEFDVTDFLPILKNNKYLSVEFAGKYQEDLDIQFLFITGTPVRNVIDIQNIWKSGSIVSYTKLLNNSRFEPRDVSLNNTASMFKIKATITGHGQEGEFIPRTHYFNINGGPTEVAWQVWKECGENPVFPQGGTWVYNRAGWCPGMATDVKEYEIDPSLITGNSVNIDYGVNTASGDTRYLISPLLVSYGSPNFSNDASIIKIIKPGLDDENSRLNPSCTNPIVIIQNTGSNDLTSLKIEYKVSGGSTEVLNWTGSLSFLKTEQIELPISGNGFWSGDNSDKFIVTVSNPNSVLDENQDNNTLTSQFELPDWYGQNFVVWLKTNNNSHENSYVIKDYNGDIVFSKSNLTDNTLYKDTLELTGGCYTLELIDTGNDGLKWWANQSQGNGYLKLKSKSSFQTLKSFQTDFGSKITYGFTVGAPVTISENTFQDFEFDIFPNPVKNSVNISLKNIQSDNLKISITDVNGNILFSDNVLMKINMEYMTNINVSNFSNGVYFVKIISGSKTSVRKLVINK